MGVLFAPWLQASWTQSPGGAERSGAGGIRRLDVSGIISSGASNNRVAIGFERCIISAHGCSVSGDGALPGMWQRTAAVCCARKQPVYGLAVYWCVSLR